MTCNPLQFLKDCFGFCFPWQPPAPTGPRVRPADYYNSRVRGNIGPPLQYPVIQPGAAKGKRVQSGYTVNADSIGIPTSNGLMRRVRVKFVEHGFEALQRVRSRCSNATVLSITSQLDNIAAGWLDNRRRGDERALRVISSDIFFCLDRIAARRERVDPMYLPTFLGEEFFAEFAARYPTARTEMALAGIDVSVVLSKHRAAASLREHDEFLRQFGMQGDTVPGEPRGQFEDISMSVYTVRENDTPPPAMPQPPQQVYQSVRERGYNNPGPSRLTDGPNLNTPGRSLTTRRYGQPKPVDRPGSNWI
ncbi:hypothetical protein CIB48_g4729 [Xylaria polymorpha]|nr:hypothetical protein CIB48_g4729 [Xylaria polymorpha]